MSSSTHAILCGACKRQVETVPDPKPDDQVTCAGCGRADRFDKVMASLKEHIGYLTQKAMSEHLRKTTRRNGFIKFEPQQVRHRDFRWMIDKEGF